MPCVYTKYIRLCRDKVMCQSRSGGTLSMVAANAMKERISIGLRNSEILILSEEYAIPTGSRVPCYLPATDMRSLQDRGNPTDVMPLVGTKHFSPAKTPTLHSVGAVLAAARKSKF